MEASYKPILSFEDMVTLVEKVTSHLSTGTYDSTTQAAVLSLSSNLKQHGSSLESSHRGALDNLQQVVRVTCRDKNLDLVSRIHLLEIIELRALKWIPNDHVTNFYKNKLSTIKNEVIGEPAKVPTPRAPVQNNSSSVLLNANAPPIGRKAASQETRNVENNSETCHKEEFTITIKTTDGDITISSSNEKLFHTAENIIKENLSHQIDIENVQSECSSSRMDKTSKPDLKYSSNMIRKLATSPLCLVPPLNWDKIVSDVPTMVKSPATVEEVNDDTLRKGDVNDDMIGKALSDLVKRPRLQ